MTDMTPADRELRTLGRVILGVLALILIVILALGFVISWNAAITTLGYALAALTFGLIVGLAVAR